MPKAVSDRSGLGGVEDRDWQRLDKWLWCARFMRARSDCAALVMQGSIRINRQATEKPHARLRVGDVLTVPVRGTVRVMTVLALGQRRGPASEARLLYREHGEETEHGSGEVRPTSERLTSCAETDS
jgi:ribosome-associated heat shock protein Hsp15